MARRFVMSACILATAAALAGLAGCGSQASDRRPRPDGRVVFRTAGCAGCHTLAAAGARGLIGPNLDTDTPRPTRSAVILRLTYGAGGMPSFRDRLSRSEMEAVADFVARNAGEVPRRAHRRRAQPAQ
jgi:mono/diheme cytochrome c family protein